MQQEELWGEAGSSQCFSFGTFLWGPTHTEQTIVTYWFLWSLSILTGAWPLAVTLAVFSSNVFRLGKVKGTLATRLAEVVTTPYSALGWTWKNCLEQPSEWVTLLKHYLKTLASFSEYWEILPSARSILTPLDCHACYHCSFHGFYLKPKIYLENIKTTY